LRVKVLVQCYEFRCKSQSETPIALKSTSNGSSTWSMRIVVGFFGSPQAGYLYASMRTEPGIHNWLPPVITNIPNDESNLNAGPLPDGRIYLLNNPVFEPKNLTSPIVEAPISHVDTLRFRDPITVATSKDGLNFSTVTAVVTCTALSANSTCVPRFHGGGKNPGQLQLQFILNLYFSVSLRCETSSGRP
jgi:hypothetical protein